MLNVSQEEWNYMVNIAEELRRVRAAPLGESQFRFLAQTLANRVVAELPPDVLAEWFTKLPPLMCDAESAGEVRPRAEDSEPKQGVNEMTTTEEESRELRMAKTEIRALEAEVAKQTDEVAYGIQRSEALEAELEKVRATGVPGRVRERYFSKAARMLIHHIVDDLDDEQLVEWCERIPSTYSGKPDMCTLADVCWGPRDGQAPGDVCGGRDPNDEDQKI